MPKFTASGTIGNSSIFDNGTNVGIGTITPTGYSSRSLNIFGSASAELHITTTGSGTLQSDGLSIGLRDSDGSANFYLRDNSFMAFGTNDSERMRITSAGNVGIGTSSTYSDTGFTSVYIGGSTGGQFIMGNSTGGGSNRYLQLSASSTSVDFQVLANAPLTFWTNTTERMRITAAGNVGIGTSSPSNILHVAQSNTGNIGIAIQNINASYNSQIRFLNAAGTEKAAVTYIQSSSALRFNNNTYDALEITSTGQIVTSFSLADNPLILSNTSANPYGPWFKFTTDPNNGTNYYWVCSALVGLTEYTRAFILSNGGLKNYQANNSNLSDERTKKDIVPIESYWNKFKAIEIVKFKYKDQTHDDYNIGVISQQVESVAPEFVDTDGFGTTPEDGIPLKAIYTADLYHATIKVLQEAMVKIENQQSQIEELKTLLKA